MLSDLMLAACSLSKSISDLTFASFNAYFCLSEKSIKVAFRLYFLFLESIFSAASISAKYSSLKV